MVLIVVETKIFLFFKTSGPAPVPTDPHVQWVRGFFPGDKAVGE